VVLGFLIAINLFCLDGLAAKPSFTFAATDVTLSSASSSGSGSSSFTLTSVNGYKGTVGIACHPAAPPAGVNLPVCEFGAIAYEAFEALTPNQAATGTLAFLNTAPPCTNPCPVNLPRHRDNGLKPGLALAGALLLGFGIRRRPARWLTLILLGVGTLTGLAGISACGGGKKAVTPGTYVYTLTAVDIDSSGSIEPVSTSIKVTVP